MCDATPRASPEYETPKRGDGSRLTQASENRATDRSRIRHGDQSGQLTSPVTLRGKRRRLFLRGTRFAFERLGWKRTRRGHCFRCPEEFAPGPAKRIFYQWLFLYHLSSPNGCRRKRPTKKRGTACGTLSSWFLSTRLTAGCDQTWSRTQGET